MREIIEYLGDDKFTAAVALTAALAWVAIWMGVRERLGR